MTNNEMIPAILSNGSTLPLRHYQSKAGNDCWGILGKKSSGERYFTRYGVPVSDAVIGDHQKVETVSVLGHTFPVVRSLNEKQQPVLRAAGQVKVAGLTKEFSLRITVSSDEKFNVGASINGKRGGSGAPVMDDL